MKLKNKMLLASAISFALSACGGSDSDNNEPITASLTGKAIDGYIEGATVYLDLNFNRQLDSNEPHAITSNLGDYRLELNQAQQECAQYVPLIVDVPVGAIDEDLGIVEKAYQMVLPPKFEPITKEDLYHVTPLTTVLWTSVEKELASNGTLTCESVKNDYQKRETLISSLNQAIDRVVSHYNIPEEIIFDDFIATGDADTSLKAQEIVRGLQQSFTATEVLKRQNPNALFAYVDYHKGDYRDNNNAYPNAWYREQLISFDNEQRSELVKVRDDFSQDIRTIIYGKTATTKGNNYTYRTSYEFESRNGDSSPYTCDIKEEIADVVSSNKTYSLINLTNNNANTFEDCIPSDIAQAITHRYAMVDYTENNDRFSSQFGYDRNAGSFPFLSDWVGFESNHHQLDLNELMTNFENLPYQYDNLTAEPDASFWVKNKTVTMKDNTQIRTSYDDNGQYRKFTTFPNGTHKEECGTDGIVWGECTN